MDDFRDLCAELLQALEVQLDELRFNNRLCKRARAAVNQISFQDQLGLTAYGGHSQAQSQLLTIAEELEKYNV